MAEVFFSLARQSLVFLFFLVVFFFFSEFFSFLQQRTTPVPDIIKCIQYIVCVHPSHCRSHSTCVTPGRHGLRNLVTMYRIDYLLALVKSLSVPFPECCVSHQMSWFLCPMTSSSTAVLSPHHAKLGVVRPDLYLLWFALGFEARVASGVPL